MKILTPGDPHRKSRTFIQSLESTGTYGGTSAASLDAASPVAIFRRGWHSAPSSAKW
jgi:hypothetical protein